MARTKHFPKRPPTKRPPPSEAQEEEAHRNGIKKRKIQDSTNSVKRPCPSEAQEEEAHRNGIKKRKIQDSTNSVKNLHIDPNTGKPISKLAAFMEDNINRYKFVISLCIKASGPEYKLFYIKHKTLHYSFYFVSPTFSSKSNCC